jgi:glutamate-ammonia-ligase adenylyltransferase
LFESLVGRTDEALRRDAGWEFLRRSDLIRYRQYNEFKTVVRWLLGATKIEEMLQELSSLAEGILLESCAHLDDKLQGEGGRLQFVLLALGKFGGSEINIGSDLDLVFVYPGTPEENTRDVAQEFVRQLVGETEGVYEIDLRLRPEGKNSPPAIELDYYREYLRARASLWERQSLTKARPIAGTPELCLEISDHLQRYVYHDPLPMDWVRQIKTMRGKMERERVQEQSGVDLKVGKGGLVDLEFLLQVLALRYGREQERSIPPGSMKALQQFVERRAVTRIEGKVIGENLSYLRRLESLVRINTDSTEFILPRDPEKLKVLAAGMGDSSVKGFLHRVAAIRKVNRSLFLRTMQRVGKA